MQFFMTLLHTCTRDIQYIPFHHPKISNNLINHNHKYQSLILTMRIHVKL